MLTFVVISKFIICYDYNLDSSFDLDTACELVYCGLLWQFKQDCLLQL